MGFFTDTEQVRHAMEKEAEDTRYRFESTYSNMPSAPMKQAMQERNVLANQLAKLIGMASRTVVDCQPTWRNMGSVLRYYDGLGGKKSIMTRGTTPPMRYTGMVDQGGMVIEVGASLENDYTNTSMRLTLQDIGNGMVKVDLYCVYDDIRCILTDTKQTRKFKLPAEPNQLLEAVWVELLAWIRNCKDTMLERGAMYERMPGYQAIYKVLDKKGTIVGYGVLDMREYRHSIPLLLNPQSALRELRGQGIEGLSLSNNRKITCRDYLPAMRLPT